ncbi:acetyltransferase domain-containing protein [Xylariomycetidae sp. FL2044]|nr:acetyltransferase domain-containing protein [Xylariomycetidae sp. FL2044]
MRLNENIAISTPQVLLVPYDKHHVLNYHEWMQDPAIQQATASEPLTLAEEYANQISWRTSGDKLTFIICQPLPLPKPFLPAPSSPPSPSTPSPSPPPTPVVYAGEIDTPSLMIGDVNMFLTPYHGDDDNEEEEIEGKGDGKTAVKGDDDDDAKKITYLTAELDIMIASPAHRGRGLGRAAVRALLRFLLLPLSSSSSSFSSSSSSNNNQHHLEGILKEYGDYITSSSSSSSSTDNNNNQAEERRRRRTRTRTRRYRLKEVVAKIDQGNRGSIKLFEGLGFERKGEVNYFGEVRMVLGLGDGDGDGVGVGGGVLGRRGGEEEDEDEDEDDGYREVRYDRSRLAKEKEGEQCHDEAAGW